MKVKIINTENENYKMICEVIEIHEKFVTVSIDNKKIDYGKSEIEFIANTDREKFNLGKYILNTCCNKKEYKGFLRHSEIIEFSKSIIFPASIKTISASISCYIWK